MTNSLSLLAALFVSKFNIWYLLTEQVKEELFMETTKLKTTILEKDYMACKLSLIENPGIFFSNVGIMLWKPFFAFIVFVLSKLGPDVFTN